MTRPAATAFRPGFILGAVGLAALLVITIANPGATRMYSWPCSLALAVALFVPALLLGWRTAVPQPALALPVPAWTALALFFVASALGSALLSRFAGPSVLWSTPLLSAVAVFFVTFDWLQADPAATLDRRARLLTGAGIFSVVVALASIIPWLGTLPGRTAAEVWDARNGFPLGHSNYTAGLALLMLPLFVALALRDRGARRAGWLVAAGLALLMLVTSGSRGGLVGLAVLMVVNVPALGRGLRRPWWLVAVTGLLLFAGLLAVNPRTRTLAAGAGARSVLQASDVQRSAMARAGLLMGEDRPLLGWGPGTTPLAYPFFRRFVDGGVEDVLQLHSLPVQLWAELGAAGLLCGLACAGLALLAALADAESRAVVLAVSGYAVFSLTDWQLDVPVFGFALAVAAALIVPAAAPPSRGGRLAVGAVLLAALVAIGVCGRRDPTPELNVKALALAHDPAQAGAAIRLLETSLELNAGQEIAHFNLGWLLVTRDPAAAERHFLAAALLVPDKGGVYFGLGLARLNQGHREAAVQAFARECVNDPIFLTSPWWRTAALRDLRAGVLAAAADLLADVIDRAGQHRAEKREAEYLLALIHWLDGTDRPGEILAAANTSQRVDYFVRHQAVPDFASAPVRFYRRERTGYPVLMRNLDLATPLDLFDVQENTLAVELGALFPAKGWLSSPDLLPALPGRPVSPKR